MKLLIRIALSLLLVLSPIACTTQEKKIIYQTEDEVYYEVEESLASKLISPLFIGAELGAGGIYFTILSSPIWAPAITIHHFCTKPKEVNVVAKEKENGKEEENRKEEIK